MSTETESKKHDDEKYLELTERIRRSDYDALLGRWEGGRWLLEERGDAKRLPNGRLEQLANRLAISRSELKNWMQFAEQYTSEADVSAVFQRYGSWSVICTRGMGARGDATSIDASPPECPLPTMVRIADLKPHPRNYRTHPGKPAPHPDETVERFINSAGLATSKLEHLKRRIQDYGFYRNVVASRDGIILAGHATVEAAAQLGYKRVPVVKLDLDADDPKAIKLLIGDNEIANLAADDDRTLIENLRDVQQSDGLVGTGYDEEQFANLIYKTTRRDEVRNRGEAHFWDVGNPKYDRQSDPIRLAVSFPTTEDRERFVDQFNICIRKKESQCWSAWWPARPKARPRDLIWEDTSSAAEGQAA